MRAWTAQSFALRDAGHEVDYVAERNAGLSDSEVLALAHAAGSVLLTADSDFGELVHRQGRVHSGVLLVRFAGLSEDDKVRCTVTSIRIHGMELPSAFAVLTPTALRIRR
ncbi:MAG: DUF5615 family PIN-like protein [Bacteroidota bacterium]